MLFSSQFYFGLILPGLFYSLMTALSIYVLSVIPSTMVVLMLISALEVMSFSIWMVKDGICLSPILMDVSPPTMIFIVRGPSTMLFEHFLRTHPVALVRVHDTGESVIGILLAIAFPNTGGFFFFFFKLLILLLFCGGVFSYEL